MNINVRDGDPPLQAYPNAHLYYAAQRGDVAKA